MGSQKTPYTVGFKRQEKMVRLSLCQNEGRRLIEVEKSLETLGQENDRLKRIVAEKELELAILREIRDKVNSQ